MDKNKLVAAGSEKLADILMFLHENNPELKKQLKTLFASLDENPKELISMIKKEISSLKKSRRFIDYYEVSSFAERLDALRLNIMNSLKEKSSVDALIAMDSFMDLHDNSLGRVDDSNGEISGVFRQGCEDLAELYAVNKLSTDETVSFVFDKYFKDEWGVFDEIIINFKKVLGAEGLNKLRVKIEAVKDTYREYRVKHGLKNIADALNDVELYIKACSFYGAPIPHEHMEIAERLIKSWKAEEALNWLNSIDLPENHSWLNDVSKLRIQALDLKGDYDLAQQERIDLFEKTMKPEFYGEVLKHANEEEKEAFKAQALQKAYDYSDPHQVIDFLYKIQEISELSKFVRHSDDRLSGNRYYTLRPVANLLEDVDPVASTLLYRHLVRPVLEGAKSKYYSYAAKDLISCADLASKILDWESYQDHNAYYREIQENNKRKFSFWEVYETQLLKIIAKKEKEKAKSLS